MAKINIFLITFNLVVCPKTKIYSVIRVNFPDYNLKDIPVANIPWLPRPASK
jgi:hypothetical protein